ncbi:MAG TPA: N-acetylmuramoyl-L-alanine amidase [Desulfotomaculum sp.]|nr:MAG: N-acetylmuramoyl-L-alanine amidase [Desulfotomaculum sp. 46_80]HAG12165.1 N-acetylmuramoyl-L-alanine amidase [Desulfotomaculum sp.]HBY04572.1 N-acetylmuramoyl-L-alanine amidase [Desulfotomaculum sp.]
MLVCLDPGHGGWDSGAVGPARTKESDVNLQIAIKVGNYLSQAATVCFTRTTDKALADPSGNVSGDLQGRVAISNSKKADCFVSIHCNSATANAHGMEIWHDSQKGKVLAQKIYDLLLPAVGLTGRGVKDDNKVGHHLYVLVHSDCPAALVEVAFISNPQEETLLKAAEFQDKAAWAIACGIASYLGLNLNTEGDDMELPKIKVVVGGKELEGYLYNGTSCAPVRALAEALGKTVTWNEATKTVTVS